MTDVQAQTGAKPPFDVDAVFERLRAAVARLRPAAIPDLKAQGHASPFEVLVASLISARTRDEDTVVLAKRLFARARTPEAMAALAEDEIARLIDRATFPEPKARDIRRLSAEIVERHGGRVPDTMAGLAAFRGVGPKIAALTLGHGFGVPAVSVDVHVHRVANRWGYVAARTPEQTMAALEAKLPRPYWIEINALLVPFGKHVCTAVRPHCGTCPVLSWCRQVGVTERR